MYPNNRKRYHTKGNYISPKGYIMVLVEDTTYLPMASPSGFVFEHRLVMAKHLGRCLLPSEVVHHINEDRVDNRIENLKLMDKPQHDKLTLDNIKQSCQNKNCSYCGKLFSPIKPGNLYCSSNCRVKAFYHNKNPNMRKYKQK